MSHYNQLLLIVIYLILALSVLYKIKLYTALEYYLSLCYLLGIVLVMWQSMNWSVYLFLMALFLASELFFLINKLETWLLPTLILVLQTSSVVVFWILVVDTYRFSIYKSILPRTLDLFEFFCFSVEEVVFVLVLYLLIQYLDRRKKIIRNLLGLKRKCRFLSSLYLSFLYLSLFFHTLSFIHGNYQLYFYTSINLMTIFLTLIIGVSLYNKSLQTEKKIANLSKSFINEQKRLELSMQFHHDYRSWLIGLSECIRKEDWRAAEGLLEDIIGYSEPLYEENIYLEISKLDSLPLQGLIYDFSQKCNEKGIIFELTIAEGWSAEKIGLIDLLRMLSISLNNAFEEVSSFNSREQKISCSFLKEAREHLVIIENTAICKKNVAKLMKKGYSTKKKHKGIGLAILQTIVRTYSNIEIQLNSSDKYFKVHYIIHQ